MVLLERSTSTAAISSADTMGAGWAAAGNGTVSRAAPFED